MTTLSESMASRWRSLLSRLGSGGDHGALVRVLDSLYHHPHREYHSLDHIAACLESFDAVREHARDADAVEFALWLHDCIYDPKASDNEERSADVAEMMLREIGAAVRAQAVRGLILATKHRGPPTTADAALVVDIDLAILGAPWPRYEAYFRQIRAEYAFVDDATFRAGRSAFLRSMLGRSVVFTTEQMSLTYESAARSNMERELAAQ